jgi:hypothetical protein
MFLGSNEWRSFRGLVLAILGETLEVYNSTRRNITGLNLYCDRGWLFEARRQYSRLESTAADLEEGIDREVSRGKRGPH